MLHPAATPLGPTGNLNQSRRATVVDLQRGRKTRVEVPVAPRRLHQFFEHACDRAPDAPALVSGDERLSYAALDARANQLAHYLMSRHNVRPGDRVGILLE